MRSKPISPSLHLEVSTEAPPAAPKGLSLRKNFSWTLVGNVVYAGCQWGILIIIAKLGSPELVGQFALGLAISAPIMMFANLNLRTIQATDARKDFIFNHYWGLRLVTTPLALLVIAGVSLLSSFSWETKITILIIGVAKSVESLSDIFFGLFQQHEWMDRIGISHIIKGVASLVAVVSGLYFAGSLLYAVLLLTLVWFLIFLFFDVQNAIFLLESSGHERNLSRFRNFSKYIIIKPYFTVNVLKSLVCQAFPLGIVVLLNSLNVNIPRYFIGYFVGERELGIFAALSYFFIVGFTIVQALSISAGPRLAQHYVNGKFAYFRKLMLNLLSGITIIGLLGLFFIWGFGETFLSLVYRPEYAAHQQLFILLAIGAIFGYLATFLRFIITVARYFKVQVPIYIMSILVSTLSCYYLIPRYGLIGSGWANVFSFLVESFFCALVVWHVLRFSSEGFAKL